LFYFFKYSDYTKKLETLLFFILEVLIPKQAFKSSDNKSNLLPNNEGTIETLQNNNSCNPAEKTFQLLFKDSENCSIPCSKIPEQSNFNLKESMNNENIIKSIYDKYMEQSGSRVGVPSEQSNFVPLESQSTVQNVNKLKLPISQQYQPMLPQDMKSSEVEIPKPPQHDRTGDLLFKNSSPNPFMEEYNYNQSNLFNSPSREPLRIQSQILEENRLPDPENIILNSNTNIPQNFSLSRKSSGLSDLFKNDQKKPENNDFIFDDNSIFSISSDKNEKENISKSEENTN
jgi:hypothetical protein